MICAPCMTAWDSLPWAIFPSGMSTAEAIPARAAYAAADADVFPVDAHMSTFLPWWTASVTATVIPRSLNDPVGFAPSTLSHTSQPVRSDRWFARTSGVPPSLSVTGSQSAAKGMRSRYSLMRPVQWWRTGVDMGGISLPFGSRC